jgi:hypothetical protein
VVLHAAHGVQSALADLLTAARAAAGGAHRDLYVRQLADALRRVQGVLHQLPDGGVQALAGLRRGAARGRSERVSFRRAKRSAGAAARALRRRRRRTLSKPAMFLFSAKNSAGLFCTSASGAAAFFPLIFSGLLPAR